MELVGKKFLVTGGAGFIGSHLVDSLLLEDVGEIVVFDNFIRGGLYNLKEALKDNRVKIFEVKGDITRENEINHALKGVDGVFHTASLCLTHCQDFPGSGFDVNIRGTFNVADACVKNSVKRMVFSSSSSVYGNALYSPIDEGHPFDNKNFYGASKIAGEAICRAFFNKYNLPYISLRYMNVYGPRQDYLGIYVAVIIKVIDRLQQNLSPVIIGDGTQAFDFVYVKDVCKANISAMKSDITDQAYNISTGKQTTITDLTKKIIKLMGKDIDITYKDVNDHTLVTNRIGSIDKAKNDLNFIAMTDIEKGLRETIEWKLSEISI